MDASESAPRPDWAPEEIDLDRPSAARLYDYYLGGFHNFVPDRELAAQVLKLVPDGPMLAQANRAFLHRVVRFMAAAGIRQFIDLGSGIPTAGNVHEVAQGIDPESRVVYVDVDPVAVAHSRAILAGDERTAVVQADIRDPDAVLYSPQLLGLLDPARPVGVLMVAVLHFVGLDQNAEGIVGRYRDRVAAGSYLGIAHGTHEAQPETVRQVVQLYRDTATPLTTRTHRQVTDLFAGWQIVEPGVVWVVQWHPDWPDQAGGDVQDPSWCQNYGAVGLLPDR